MSVYVDPLFSATPREGDAPVDLDEGARARAALASAAGERSGGDGN